MICKANLFYLIISIYITNEKIKVSKLGVSASETLYNSYTLDRLLHDSLLVTVAVLLSFS
jgi:hypothetical protein